MLREDRELLTDLKRVCNEAGPFALEYMAGSLSVEAEEAYAFRLAEVAGRFLIHARTRQTFIVDGESTQFVIDADCGQVNDDVHELPPSEDRS